MNLDSNEKGIYETISVNGKLPIDIEAIRRKVEDDDVRKSL